MAESLPRFEAVKTKSQYYWQGERLFQWAANDDFHCWIILYPKGNDECFTVEVGWSRLSRAPELSMRPSAEDPDAALSSNPQEYVCRLGQLMEESDRWWRVDRFDLARAGTRIPAAEARERVTPAVESSIRALREYAMPFFDQAIERCSRKEPEGAG